MSLFRQFKPTVTERSTCLIQLRLVERSGETLDPSEAWVALLEAFKNHPRFLVQSALISPDKESSNETPQ